MGNIHIIKKAEKYGIPPKIASRNIKLYTTWKLPIILIPLKFRNRNVLYSYS